MKLLSVSGKFVKAHEFGVEKEEEPELELTSDEAAVVEKVIVMIMLVGIMKSSVENDDHPPPHHDQRDQPHHGPHDPGARHLVRHPQEFR